MSETMSMLFRKEIAILDRHLDAGVITPEDYRERVATAKAQYGIGGTQPPTNTTTAAAAAAPRRSALASVAMEKPTPPKKEKVKWGIMELPEALDKDGDPITEGLGKITVRAIEAGEYKMIPNPDDPKGKKEKKWVPNGQPSGKIGIGASWNNEVKFTLAQYLQWYAKQEEIYRAIMGYTDENGEHVPGLAHDCQPRDILVL